ncbi:MAG: hypothetical protein OXG13_01560 [Gemmatimonadaceae bacterium]|nr:hypothetical protein [Gemmatimonadaceae bacterium]
MQSLRRLSLTGLALWLAVPLAVAAQDDSGTLEVLVEGGASGDSGTSSATFERRKVSDLVRVDIGPGRSVTDPGQRIGTGSGTVITPTVTVTDLVTEASVYPRNFRHVTSDSLGRMWTTAKDPSGLYTFSDSTSWRRVSLSRPRGVQDLGRDAQGRIWVAEALGNSAYRISGNTMTKYSGFNDLGVADLFTFASGRGDTVWMGGYRAEGSNPALLLRFDGREWRRFSRIDGLPHFASIEAMAVDSTGTVWGRPSYDPPDYIDPPGPFPSLVSYDGREWRGYSFSLGEGFIGSSGVGMVVDPGGTLWITTPYLLAQKTGGGWMSYEYVSRKGGGSRMGRSMAAERAGRIWIHGDGGWIGVFESGQLYRTPSGSNPDVFGSPLSHPRQKLYYDGEVLWTAGSRLGRWRLPGPATSMEDGPGSPGASGQSRLLDIYPNPFNALTVIGFELARRQPVSLRVHNLTGQRVTTLAEGVYPEGVFAVSWDGRDDRGRELASGVYLARLRLAERALSQPLTLVR